MYHIRLSLLHALALFQWIYLDISVYNFTGKKDLNVLGGKKVDSIFLLKSWQMDQ